MILVERRNQIAHGSTIFDILGISELEPYIEFLEKYCQAIFEILFEELIKQESIYKFQKIEKVLKIFPDLKALGFEIENYTIEIGDVLIVQTTEGSFYKTPILSIRSNKKPYSKHTITDKEVITVGVEATIKENQTFYLIKQ